MNSRARTSTPRHAARASTIIWGTVILAVAGLLLVDQAVTLTVDPVMVALGLLVGVGVALVTGGLLSLRSRADDVDERDDDVGNGNGGDPFDHGGIDNGSAPARY